MVAVAAAVCFGVGLICSFPSAAPQPIDVLVLVPVMRFLPGFDPFCTLSFAFPCAVPLDPDVLLDVFFWVKVPMMRATLIGACDPIPCPFQYSIALIQQINP